MRLHKRRPTDRTIKCECSDPGCPACRGECRRPAGTVLFRIDMEDRTGTAFCETCADDAFASGLFCECEDHEK